MRRLVGATRMTTPMSKVVEVLLVFEPLVRSDENCKGLLRQSKQRAVSNASPTLFDDRTDLITGE